MIYIVVAVVIVFVIGKFFIDRDKMIEKQVDNQGGMRVKYKTLIDLLTQEPSAKIVETKRDMVHIRSQGNPCSTDFFIIEHFDASRIEYVGNMGLLGVHKLDWKFPQNFSQEKMYEKIGTDINEKMQKIFSE